MLDLTLLFVAGGAVLAGAAVQSSVGLGLGMVAAPVVTLLDPTLMPGSLLVAGILLPMLTLASEWRHIDLRGMFWALAGRILGTVGGVWILTAVTPNTLGLVVGVMVLVSVVLTIWTIRVRATPGTLAAAGALSGIGGTATAIGGPPMAVVYQNDPGPRVRSTLAGYFLVGVTVSLLALALGGQLDRSQVATGLALLPFVLAGYLLARPLRRVVDGGRLRAVLLVLVTVSGAVLIGQSLI